MKAKCSMTDAAAVSSGVLLFLLLLQSILLAMLLLIVIVRVLNQYADSQGTLKLYRLVQTIQVDLYPQIRLEGKKNLKKCLVRNFCKFLRFPALLSVRQR